ncbi:MAG: histidine phosphatase family protein [Ruminococcaceae bacterium]|nr:histidine phosphatase family protein [Oscillospiraceae bacterium]
MKTVLYIIRHGNSLGNLTKTFYGHHNGPLTETGHEQAKRVAVYFENKKVDVIYSSDLMRAIDTVKPVALSKGLEIIGDRRLREIYAGKWENRNIDELIAEYPEEYGIWRYDKANSRCTGGESVRELQKRIFEAVTDIVQNNIGKSIMVSTHATPIMTLKASFEDLPIESINGTDYVLNASVTTVTYDDGKWDIVSYGENSHLDGLITEMTKGF